MTVVHLSGPLAGLPVHGTAEHLARLPLPERSAYLDLSHPAQLGAAAGDETLNDPHISHLIPDQAEPPAISWTDAPTGTGGKVVAALMLGTIAYFVLRILA